MARLSPRLAVLAATLAVLTGVPAAPALAVPVPQAAPDVARALSAAAQRGTGVLVTGLSTETRTVEARPDGTLAATVQVGKSGWAEVFWDRPKTPFWGGDGDGAAGVGYCGWVGCPAKVARSYFVFDTGFLAGSTILAASFDTVVTHSPSCQGRLHQLFAASGPVGPGLTWVNQPAARLVGTQSAPVAYAGCPGSKPLSFSATGAVNPIGASAYSLRAAVEGDLADEEDPRGDRFAWRKYDPAQTRLTVIFEPAA